MGDGPGVNVIVAVADGPAVGVMVTVGVLVTVRVAVGVRVGVAGPLPGTRTAVTS